MDKIITYLFMDQFLQFFNSLLFLWRWSLKCFQKLYTTPIFYFWFLILILNPGGQDERRRLLSASTGSLCRSTVSVWPSFDPSLTAVPLPPSRSRRDALSPVVPYETLWKLKSPVKKCFLVVISKLINRILWNSTNS